MDSELNRFACLRLMHFVGRAHTAIRYSTAVTYISTCSLVYLLVAVSKVGTILWRECALPFNITCPSLFVWTWILVWLFLTVFWAGTVLLGEGALSSNITCPSLFIWRWILVWLLVAVFWAGTILLGELALPSDITCPWRKPKNVVRLRYFWYIDEWSSKVKIMILNTTKEW
jgi:hypothetical protein